MAYVTGPYTKRGERVGKSKSRKHMIQVSRNTKRLVHILFGILIGFIFGYGILFGNRFWSEKCRIIKNNHNYSKSESLLENTESVKSSEKLLLFVGVMTAEKYLTTRANAVHKTWGREIPGKIEFFSSEQSRVPSTAPDLPLVSLKGVDDSYPPQKKSFMMLQYMWEHYGDEFEWFLRADDDVYVRPEKINKFLRSVNSSKPYFIGQAGRGNQEEFGLLSLEYDENFCMGGPGIIMSAETLRRVAPHIKYCLQHLYTTHEDVELGRCVQKFAQISCTWSYEMQSILYHNSSGKDAFTGNLKQKEVHRAITLHPVKQHVHMYRIHNYIRGLEIRQLQQKKIELFRDLLEMKNLVEKIPNEDGFPNEMSDFNEESSFLGLQPNLNKYQPRQEENVLTWDMISRSVYSASNFNPRRKMESYYKEGLDDVIREVMDNINAYSRERGRIIEFQQILYGYMRVNPMYGTDYVLDILLTYKKYRGKKMTVPVRRHAYIQQQFTGLEIREVTETGDIDLTIPVDHEKFQEDISGENNDGKSLIENALIKLPNLLIPSSININNNNNDKKLINFILPLSGRINAFKRFMKNYENICIHENVALYVIYFIDKTNNIDYNNTLLTINELRVKYSVNIKIVPVYDKFARASALNIGMEQTRGDELLFFIDVDMIWTKDTLYRIRLNTVKGKSVYFPIVFTQYDPNVVYQSIISPNHFLINHQSGFWRQFGYGIMSSYKSDIKKIGGFDTSIRGWGKEDVDLFEKFILNSSNISIFRSVDPTLVHVFHIVECDPNLDESRLGMCRNTRGETFASVDHLADIIYKNKEKILQFASKGRS